MEFSHFRCTVTLLQSYFFCLYATVLQTLSKMVHMSCCAANIADILPTRKSRTCWNYCSLSSEELKGLTQAFPKVDSAFAAKHFTQNHIIIIEMIEENLGKMCLSNI